VAQHLHDSRQVVVGQIAAKTGVGLVEHLRGLKPFGFADEDLLDVGGNDRGLAVAVDVIVAASLKCFHQRALAAIAKRDDRKIAVLCVRTNDPGNLQCTHLPHVCRAKMADGVRIRAW